MPSGAEEGRAGVRILVLRPVDSGSDAWDAGARSESHTRVSLLCGALGVGAGVRTELSAGGGAAAAPNLDVLRERVCLGPVCFPPSTSFDEGNRSGRRPGLCLSPLLSAPGKPRDHA